MYAQINTKYVIHKHTNCVSSVRIFIECLIFVFYTQVFIISTL